jgi:hypothetical protein
VEIRDVDLHLAQDQIDEINTIVERLLQLGSWRLQSKISSMQSPRRLRPP